MTSIKFFRIACWHGCFGSVFVLAIGLLVAGVIRFWREISPGVPRSAEIAEASHNALTLKYLDGGHGKGCNEADDAFTLLRRRFHHFTFYGFMLCFAATVVATGYHYVAGWEAPYPFFSLPVMLARWAVSVCLSARPGYCGSICGGRRYMAMRVRNPWIAALFCCCS
ncbi:citrate utilization protein B [Salmonella enterica subsp. enterica serovar Sanjuan]|uniref:Citrate utilization protein B n=1 Tax=Salmonella enterica subsp. enterica serovar Sanjuan TaxID=1160765 RepID=A0A447NYU5_SALET|nr:citrate utilization protein B [Salmonella enterica subsp. enterica serovar Sanjuan]